ncbi:hypothetical protein BDV09DRAFT_201521 [Aspergillus tetrazonus]
MITAQSPRLQAFKAQVLSLLDRERAMEPASIQHVLTDDNTQSSSIPSLLSAIAMTLESNLYTAEATALNDAVERITANKNFGGLGIRDDQAALICKAAYASAAFIVEAMLLSLSAELSSRKFLPSSGLSRAARPMTLAEKIFVQHLVGSNTVQSQLKAGTVIRVGLDWVLSSELSW